MSSHATTPFNQNHRITTLRLSFLLILPLIVIAKPVLGDDNLLLEGMEAFGGFMIICAVLGRFWCIVYIGGRKNAEVVQTGPYSICRHPLYLFSFIGVIGFGLALGMVLLAAAMGTLAFLILMYTAKQEEAFLRGEFGAAYGRYAETTPLIIPNVAAFHTPGEVTFSVTALRRNLFDALVFLAFFPVVEFAEIVKDAELFPALPLF